MPKKLQIQVNGTFLDLSESQSDISLKYASAKLGELQTRQGISSYEITLPATNRNLELLSGNNISAKLFLNSSLLNKGFLQVVDINKVLEDIRIIFYAGNTNWYDVLKDKNLTDLDLNHMDFVYNLSAVDKGRFGISFPLMDSGLLTLSRTKPVVNFLELPVIVSTKEIFKQIFAQNGFGIEGNILEDAKFKSDHVCRDFFNLANNERVRESLGGEFTGDVSDSFSADSSIAEYVRDFTIQSESLKTTRDGTPLFSLDSTNTIIQADTGISINIKVDIKTFNLTDPHAVFNAIAITIRNSTGDVVDAELRAFFSPNNSFLSGQVNFENIILRQGDTANVRLFGGRDAAGTSPTTVTVNCAIEATITASNSTLFPDAYVFAETLLPDLTHSEFIREIAFDYCLLFSYDERNKTVHANTFDILEQNKVNAPDWTNKILNGDVFLTDFVEATSGYAQKNKLNRANEIGGANLLINNRYLPEESSLFDSNFDGLNPVQILDGTFATSNMGYLSIDIDNPIDITSYADNSGLVELTLDNVSFIKINSLILIRGELGGLTDGLSAVYSVRNVSNTTNKIILDAGYNGTISLDSDDVLYVVDVDKVPTTRALVTRYNAITNFVNPRISYTDGITTFLPQRLDIGHFTKSDIGTVQDTATDQLNYTSIIDKYYNLITRMLNNNTYIEALALLDDGDIENLDFATPVYVDGQYYYINEIDSYDGQTGIAKLVKL